MAVDRYYQRKIDKFQLLDRLAAQIFISDHFAGTNTFTGQRPRAAHRAKINAAVSPDRIANRRTALPFSHHGGQAQIQPRRRGRKSSARRILWAARRAPASGPHNKPSRPEFQRAAAHRRAALRQCACAPRPARYKLCPKATPGHRHAAWQPVLAVAVYQ